MDELEKLIALIRVGCPAAFADCFEAHSWLGVETPEIQQAWATREPAIEGRVKMLTREVIQLHREAYYAL